MEELERGDSYEKGEESCVEVWRSLVLEIKMHGEKVESNAPNTISNVRLSLHTGKESDRCRGFVFFMHGGGA